MKLEKNIRREVNINDNDHVVWIGPKGVLLKQKRKRVGKLLSWEELLKLANVEGLDCKSLEDVDSDSAD